MQVDILFQGGKVYNTSLRKFRADKVAVKDDKVIYVGPDEEGKISAEQVVDVSGKYLLPGLIDIHMHIESSMTAPAQFAREVIKRGVTTVVSEPHEIANVFGLAGVEAMIAAGEDAVIDIYYAAPSSVPSTTPELETTGGQITPEMITELAGMDEVLCLGEVMDNRAVIEQPDSTINQIITAFRTAAPTKPIEGHIPNFIDHELARLMFRGVDSDHTYHTLEQAEARLKLGVQIQIQEKSMYPELFAYLQENACLDQLALVTDDVMADTLQEEGHLDKIYKKAVDLGFKPEEAIYMATASPARRMNLIDRGSLRPGKLADIVVVDALEEFTVTQVYKRGKLVVQAGEVLEEKAAGWKDKKFPAHFYKSVDLELLTAADLTIKADAAREEAAVRTIEVQTDTTYTEEKIRHLPVEAGEVKWEESDLAVIGVFCRYDSDSRSLGLVGGATIKAGAVAATYAHDHHNLLVVGQNRPDAVLAANWVIENNGGYCVFHEGELLASLKLPVAGIISEEPVGNIARDLKQVRQSLHELGYEHYNAIMSFSTHTLPVSPKLKITDKGLIRVNTGELLPLFVDGR
ncbi:MAG: adenine deaminase C-terminal domain-containing protein [Bacillota bacterium]